MSSDPSCPICDADVPLSGDERVGSEVFCAYCRAPLTIKVGRSEEEVELEDDF